VVPNRLPVRTTNNKKGEKKSKVEKEKKNTHDMGAKRKDGDHHKNIEREPSGNRKKRRIRSTPVDGSHEIRENSSRRRHIGRNIIFHKISKDGIFAVDLETQVMPKHTWSPSPHGRPTGCGGLRRKSHHARGQGHEGHQSHEDREGREGHGKRENAKG
jgi:hypothetical protein